MSDETKKLERSAAGDVIYRYTETHSRQVPAEARSVAEITEHIERHLGKIARVFRETESDAVHLDVYHVEPTTEFPCHRLITSGMSDLPMIFPEDIETRYDLELTIALPAHWRVDEDSFEDEKWYWPVRLLKELARFPHKYSTWLYFGHTIPNSNPPEPYTTDSNLRCALLLPPATCPSEFRVLEIPPDRKILFLAVVPLYEDEMNYKLEHGLNALIEKFDQAQLEDIIDPKRPSVLRTGNDT